MQIKKQAIEKAILDQAEQEFYSLGFEKASIRRIIRDSGTSIGNFYNYFENKEALFDALVGEEYEQFLRFITQHQQIAESLIPPELLNQNEWKLHITEIVGDLLPIILKQIPEFNKRFVILVEGSKGSRYEDARNRLIAIVKEHLAEHAAEAEVEVPNEISDLLAEQFISGIIRIIKLNQTDNDARNKLILKYLMFYFIGVTGMLGFEV